jgi:hypothetical protein
MCVIAVTATVTADWSGLLLDGVFVLSVHAMLACIVVVTFESHVSRRSLVFEVNRVRRLPAGVTQTWSEGTVRA